MAAAHIEQTKTCTKCGEVKLLSEYSVLRTVRDGRRSRCKVCEAFAARAHYHANRDANLERQKARYNSDPEKGRSRALEWHRSNRERSLDKSRAWKAKNRDRVLAYNAEHYADNIDYHRARYAEWAQQNRLNRREYMREWYRANPGKHTEYANTRRRDPKVRIENAVRCRLWYELRGGKQGRRTFCILGYTSDKLKVHLERQFSRGMSWDNYGKWHVDHILPLASFNYQTTECPDFRAAWALTNLRPMWAKDNIAKGAKRQTLL